jgi:hypothetical protein
MRLKTQDQLTAVARFFEDVWRETRDRTGKRGVERVKVAFGLWVDAPSEATWDGLEATLRDLVDEATASRILGDIEPYLGRTPRS